MSSILEALKKLEAEKNAQQVAIEAPEAAFTTDQMAQSLLGNYADSAPRERRTSPLLLVLGGGIFTLIFIGITVSLAVLVLNRVQGNPEPDVPAVATVPAKVQVPEAAESPAPALTAIVAEPAPETPAAPQAIKAQKEAVAAAATPKTRPKPEPVPEVEPVPEPQLSESLVVTPVPVVTEARYEPYVPKPAASEEQASAPLPSDIRTLPMLSRSERSQYRLEGLTINMLNEASATRPLGNALINLEKIFIGETLPGSNATLVDVKSHGIAIEIMSTRQRYYLPR